MSVDRLAGSGTAGGDTEPARRAQRRGTGRRRGADDGARGVAGPGQAGEATAGPESDVILLGQEPGPGTSAATPERAAAAPQGQEPAEAAGHAAAAGRTGAVPTKDAAAADAAAPATAAITETAATTEAAAKDAAASETTATTEAAAKDAAASETTAPT